MGYSFVLFYVSLVISRGYFHCVFIGHTQNMYSPWAKSHFPVGKSSSGTATNNTFLEAPSPNFIQTASYLTAALKLYHWITTILRIVSHFNLSALANETLSVSLCREIDDVFGAVRTCFDHVLSKFSGFSWERLCVCQYGDANSSSNWRY